MSEEQKNDLPDLSSQGSNARQAERVSQRAEIIHDDGRREQVELEAQRFWSGALPRPEDFAKYAEIVADAPERILRMAEKEQDHRIDLERQIVPANNNAGARGQWLGAGISVLALVLAVVANWIGAPWQVSTAIVGVPVLSVARSLVAAFRNPSE
ncbi:DUF2335 domain-containing protein [Ruegeria pomeroyi]|uniref:DUF2335 domain-containing protein n=1 Tax=Ruegeria pomeroyi TaxID=89184 RepID=UPI001F1A0268|nr:DUF2335 domain-containing protein [Ruegeria pomeroyi]MCE8508801.1 DUF2335 domain-containing protein [Ruegeria pomeroyi]